MAKRIVVLEISNTTDEQIQTDLGQAFADFCKKNKGTGITASVLKEKAAKEVIGFMNGEEKINE